MLKHELRHLSQSLMVLVSLVATLPILPCVPVLSDASPAVRDRVQLASQQLKAAAPNANVRFDSVTGVMRFARFGPEGLRMRATAVTPREAADSFLEKHGDVFGVRQEGSELRFLGDLHDDIAQSDVLIYQQFYQEIPVYGARVRFHVRSDRSIGAVHGIYLPDLEVGGDPILAGTRAAELARQNVDSIGAAASGAQLETVVAGPYVYRTGLMRGASGQDHLTYRVEVTDHRATREFLFIDAQTGKIVDRFNGVVELERHLAHSRYDGGGWTMSPVWSEGDPLPTGDSADDTLLDTAEDVYNVFRSISGGSYRSYDDQDSSMMTIYGEFPPDEMNCPNAQWNGEQVWVCDGLAADDVVAHEWTHAYTQYTHGLVYGYQPGALNEAYSDIFGELTDLVNGLGTDSPDSARTDDSCSTYGGAATGDSSYRWLIGEDGSLGVLRDMWTPTCKGDPGRVSDSQYSCASYTEGGDWGGVHTNSGVPNHAFALIVDGGSYNGHSITGLGVHKAAAIYWRAMTQYQDEFTDFADHADALEASCEDLVGSRYYLVADGGLVIQAPTAITSADTAQVAEAIEAVEMRADPPCGFDSLLDTSSPRACSAKSPVEIHSQSFATQKLLWMTWTRSNSGVTPEDWTDRNWTWSNDLPGGRSGGALWAADPLALGDCADDDESGVLEIESPEVHLPTSATHPRLSFVQYVATEAGYDGGNVSISVNGGPYSLIGDAAFTFNPYNDVLQSAATNTNPMAGEPAFTGTDEGGFSGSWATSVIQLSGYASAGDTIRILFRFGVDGCNGVDGWYIDDFKVYNCPGR